MLDGAGVSLDASGTFNGSLFLQSDGAGSFESFGAIVSSGGGIIDVPFGQHGTLAVTAGQLTIQSDLHATGAFQVANGATLQFGSTSTGVADVSFAPSTSLTGAGVVRFHRSAYVLPGNTALTGTLNVDSGSVRVTAASAQLGTTLDVSGIGTVHLDGSHATAGILTGSSRLIIENGRLDLTNAAPATLTARLELRDGELGTAAGLTLRGAEITGTGTIEASMVTTQGFSLTLPPPFGVIRSPAILRPGGVDLAGLLSFTGGLSIGDVTDFEFELGGVDRGVTHDAIDVSLHLALEGVLAVSLLDGFRGVVSDSDVFGIFEADSLSGAFDNVASGMRLTTTDGSGSFLVSYGLGSAFGPNRVVLSGFASVAEPTLGGITLASYIGMLRLVARRTRSGERRAA
jgi:hypothetical protein